MCRQKTRVSAKVFHSLCEKRNALGAFRQSIPNPLIPPGSFAKAQAFTGSFQNSIESAKRQQITRPCPPFSHLFSAQFHAFAGEASALFPYLFFLLKAGGFCAFLFLPLFTIKKRGQNFLCGTFAAGPIFAAKQSPAARQNPVKQHKRPRTLLRTERRTVWNAYFSGCQNLRCLP